MKIRINRQLLRTASIPGENVLEHSWLQRQGGGVTLYLQRRGEFIARCFTRFKNVLKTLTLRCIRRCRLVIRRQKLHYFVNHRRVIDQPIMAQPIRCEEAPARPELCKTSALFPWNFTIAAVVDNQRGAIKQWQSKRSVVVRKALARQRMHIRLKWDENFVCNTHAVELFEYTLCGHQKRCNQHKALGTPLFFLGEYSG